MDVISKTAGKEVVTAAVSSEIFILSSLRNSELEKKLKNIECPFKNTKCGKCIGKR